MAVRLFLLSGAERMVEGADSASIDDPFFVVTRSYPEIGSVHTVLSLCAQDVIGAEILDNGIFIKYVFARALRSK